MSIESQQCQGTRTDNKGEPKISSCRCKRGWAKVMVAQKLGRPKTLWLKQSEEGWKSRWTSEDDPGLVDEVEIKKGGVRRDLLCLAPAVAHASAQWVSEGERRSRLRRNFTDNIECYRWL